MMKQGPHPNPARYTPSGLKVHTLGGQGTHPGGASHTPPLPQGPHPRYIQGTHQGTHLLAKKPNKKAKKGGVCTLGTKHTGCSTVWFYRRNTINVFKGAGC